MPEHKQDSSAEESIEKSSVAPKLLTRLFGPTTDVVGEHLSLEFSAIAARRRANLMLIIKRAEILHQEAEVIESQELPLNVSVPLLEAASLCEDDYLREHWAALLANATSSVSGKASAREIPSFVDVLRNLSPVEATVLRALMKCQNINLELKHFDLHFPSAVDFQVVIGNLRRQSCITPELGFTALTTEESPEPILIFQDGQQFAEVNLTWFGMAFVEACQSSSA